MRNTAVLTAAFIGLLSTGMPVDASTWTIPGTVNASGLNGTKFVSDIAITNTGALPVLATLALVPANGTSPATIFLGPGQTVVHRNLLQQVFGASGAAATVVSAPSPLLIRARTYNDSQNGTFGVALPVVADDRMLAAGAAADSLWIAQSADGATGFRTNIAVVFPDAGGGDAIVTVYDANGNAAGSQDFSTSAAGFQQFAVGAFAGAVAVGRAQLVVSRGRATAYSVVVDNVTGDSSLFAFGDAPAGRQDVLVNGVARAGGRNGTFFRTDARIYNPNEADVTVTVAFHANQTANASPATATFTVPGRRIRDVVDVLASLLALPVGSAGALRFTSDTPLAILCRTSNVDPSGASPGTFGAQQQPVPLLSFQTSADAGAVVTGIRESAAFRTNVGFAAGADGASYSLTLKDASGATVASTTRSLGPFGWTQPNVTLDLFPGTPIPEDATLLVQVTAGSVDVFDSSIDNISGDPVVTPVMPLPVALPSSASIGPAGGSVQSPDGRLALLIPAGALASPTTITIGSEASDAPQGIGSGYVLSPPTVSFAKPLIARVSYGSDDVAGSGAGGLAIAFRQADGWYSLGGGLVDAARRTVSVELSPGALSVSARRPEVGVFWGPHLAILQAWEIAPKTVNVLGGNQLHFSANYAGPPSSIPCITPYCAARLTSPYAVNVVWYVGGQRGGFPIIGTVSPDAGTSTTYTAPCAYGAPVGVSFRISDPRISDPSVFAEHGAIVNVFARQWRLTVEQKKTALCPTGFFEDWTSAVVEQFSIKDGGGTVAGMAKVDGSQGFDAPVDCFKKAGCTWDFDKTWPNVSVQAVQGALDPSRGMVFSVDFTEEARVVGFQATCNGQKSIPVPTEAGPERSTADLVLGIRGDSIRIPDNDQNYVRWTLRPVLSCP